MESGPVLGPLYPLFLLLLPHFAPWVTMDHFFIRQPHWAYPLNAQMWRYVGFQKGKENSKDRKCFYHSFLRFCSGPKCIHKKKKRIPIRQQLPYNSSSRDLDLYPYVISEHLSGKQYPHLAGMENTLHWENDFLLLVFTLKWFKPESAISLSHSGEKG